MSMLMSAIKMIHQIKTQRRGLVFVLSRITHWPLQEEGPDFIYLNMMQKSTRFRREWQSLEMAVYFIEKVVYRLALHF